MKKAPFLVSIASVFLMAAGCGSSGDNGNPAPSGGGASGAGGTQPTAGAAGIAGAGGANAGGSSGSNTGGSAGATGGAAGATGGAAGATGGSSGTGGIVAGSGGAPSDASTGGGGSGGAGGTLIVDAGNDSALPGDTYLPWYGGSSYYAKWSNGPPSDPSFFMLTVWLQSPPNAAKYKQIGINFFTGLWEGPTDAQLTALAAAGIPTICDQGGVWQAHLADKTIRAWLQPDEPDNAQAKPDGGGYDPCIAPATIIASYDTMKKNDPSRPVYLGLGRGVADTQWFGRGTCTGKTEMYAEYSKGADIVGFDIYPANDGVAIEIVASGLDNLLTWSGRTKPVIGIIEASNINNTNRPTPAQIKSEVWMDIVHGAAGIEYFCHRFAPTFSETDCLDDAPTAAALKAINAQITALAPVLNSPPVANGVTVQSSTATIPVDTLLKRYAGATYLFAAEMRAGSTTATFTLRGMPAAASAEVVGESRTIPVNNGVFADTFQSYGIHIYRITY